ncbi:hypothetical protein ACO22_01232 [Paracoccidioides brasiliensis]|uniref:DUF7924 domain-containing protein n=1 Tax=Paracoccidioides brasiliensis TaxID=121759 RepID=A0A1D2JM46_PARBR|nr:hypothetical protein ACO22_01232 [Paracoccidioides brasiliensis]
MLSCPVLGNHPLSHTKVWFIQIRDEPPNLALNQHGSSIQVSALLSNEIQVNDRKRKRAWESEQPLLRPARRLEKRQCMSPTNSGDDAVHRIKEHGSINRPSTRAIDLEKNETGVIHIIDELIVPSAENAINLSHSVFPHLVVSVNGAWDGSISLDKSQQLA